MDRSEISKFFDEERDMSKRVSPSWVADPELIKSRKLESDIVHELVSRIRDSPEELKKWLSDFSILVEELHLPPDTVKKIALRVQAGLASASELKKNAAKEKFNKTKKEEQDKLYEKNPEWYRTFYEKHPELKGKVLYSQKDVADLNEIIKNIDREFNPIHSFIDKFLRDSYENGINNYISGCDLPEQIKRIDKILANTPEGHFNGYHKYEKEVLLKMKSDLEKDFEIEHQTIERRKQLGITDSTETSSSESEISLRAKVLLHMVLIYKELQLPEGTMVEPVAKFFQSFLGGDLKRIKEVLKAPTAYKDDKNPSAKKQSLQKLLKALDYVVDELKLLKLNPESSLVEATIEDLKQDFGEE